jgi:hypothetical protein
VRRHRLDAVFLIQVCRGFKFCPSVFEIIGLPSCYSVYQTLLCSISAPRVNIVPLLDVHQLLMSFAGALKYSEPRTFSLIISRNVLKLL